MNKQEKDKTMLGLAMMLGVSGLDLNEILDRVVQGADSRDLTTTHDTIEKLVKRSVKRGRYQGIPINETQNATVTLKHVSIRQADEYISTALVILECNGVEAAGVGCATKGPSDPVRARVGGLIAVSRAFTSAFIVLGQRDRSSYQPYSEQPRAFRISVTEEAENEAYALFGPEFSPQ